MTEPLAFLLLIAVPLALIVLLPAIGDRPDDVLREVNHRRR